MEKVFEFKKGEEVTPHLDKGFSVIHLMAKAGIDYKLSWTQYVITILRDFTITISIDYNGKD